jgi:hypothetical protein
MYTDAETAAYLNDSGWITAHGKHFTADLGHGLRKEHQIVNVRKGGGYVVSKGVVMSGGSEPAVGWGQPLRAAKRN